MYLHKKLIISYKLTVSFMNEMVMLCFSFVEENEAVCSSFLSFHALNTWQETDIE